MRYSTSTLLYVYILMSTVFAESFALKFLKINLFFNKYNDIAQHIFYYVKSKS